MNVVAFPLTGAADVEEPDWEALLPYPDDAAEQLDVGALGFNATQARHAAHREWERVTAAMREAETLAPVNGRQIQRLVIAYVRHDHAVAETIRTGAVRLAPKTRVQMLNLWTTIANQASAEASVLEAELGLTPRRRAAVGKVKGRKTTTRAIDGFLGASRRA